jgi:preprotein translocase subunit SecY
MYRFLDKIAEYIPSVEKPKFALDLNTKLKWTLISLILFAALASIYPIGVKIETIKEGFLDMIMGSKIGSLATLGIGPIVMASIILTLLKGAEIINFDLSNPVDYRRYHVLQKILIVFFCFFEGAAYLASGRVPIEQGMFLIVYIQIVLGGLLIVFLDEIVSKWGIGSGVSLFIAAGVSFAIVWSLFNPLGYLDPNIKNGYVFQVIDNILAGNFTETIKAMFPIIVTIAVFLIVVFLETMKLDLPLSARGISRKFSLPFMYMSNIPVIFAVAFVSVLSMIIVVFGSKIVIFGHTLDSLLLFNGFSMHPYGLLKNPFAIPEVLSNTFIILKLIAYVLFFIVLCIFFGWVWAETSGMTSEGLAEQLKSANLEMTGFRRDPRVVKKVFDRYIPYLIVLSSIVVGILAVTADLFGTIGSGTGILLTVAILHRYYQQLKLEGAFETYPIFKKIFGES